VTGGLSQVFSVHLPCYAELISWLLNFSFIWQIEKYSNYRIDLIGHLEGIREALLFGYQMNGTEVHAQLSMLQQKVSFLTFTFGLKTIQAHTTVIFVKKIF
jgi:hypothetical protein